MKLSISLMQRISMYCNIARIVKAFDMFLSLVTLLLMIAQVGVETFAVYSLVDTIMILVIVNIIDC